MIKVIVADDHAVVRRGLRQILAETSDVIVGGEASDAGELWKLVGQERWDAVILDINVPGRSGLEVLADLKREYPRLPVLILTVHSEDQYAMRALRAGASGFLTKESAPARLVEAVRKVATGGRFVTPELAEHLAATAAGDSDAPAHESLPTASCRFSA